MSRAVHWCLSHEGQMVVPTEQVLPLTVYISDIKLLLFGLWLFQGIRKEQK